MTNPLLKKKIPTIIGLVLILIGALTGVIFVGQRTDFLPRATPEFIPKKVKITNITDKSFTISWITQEPAIGFIKLGPEANKLDTTVTDERDLLSGESTQFRTHYVTVQGLSPQTLYYFKLGSQGNQLYDNNGQAFSVTTAPTLASPPPVDTAYGTVMTGAQTPAEGAIVYVTLSDATPLSALVKQNGNWAVSLSSARTLSLNEFVTYDSQSARVDLLVEAGTDEPTRVATTTANDQPVDTIVLGESREDLTDSTEDAIEANPTPIPESKFSLQAIEPTEPETEQSLTITNPARDGVVLATTQPEFKGLAPSGTTLTLTIHSSQIVTGSSTVDEAGAWSWVPPENLEPGEHTLTITYNDQQGLLHTITRSFVVQASEGLTNSPAYIATPSATPQTQPTQTLSPTTIPTRAPTSSLAPSPTIQPTSAPAITTSPSPTPIPEVPDPVLPQAGTAWPTFALLLLGALLILGGVILPRS